MKYTGSNEAGLEFGLGTWKPLGKFPGSLLVDYFPPNNTAVAHFRERFANTFRLPVAWERLQPVAFGDLDVNYASVVDGAIQNITSQNAVAILDIHNCKKVIHIYIYIYIYNFIILFLTCQLDARYWGNVLVRGVNSTKLSDLWVKLANKYSSNMNVWFGMMNEPHDMDTLDWFNIAQDTITAIRNTNAKNKILVPGTCWSGAHSWSTGCGKDISNAKAALNIVDPADNMLFEMHQYFDSDYSGTQGTVDCVIDGSTTLRDATAWLRNNRKRGFIGEFGVPEFPNCRTQMDKFLTFMEQNSDVWLGWTYWAAGSVSCD